MSNKKRISKKCKNLDISSLKKEYFGSLFKLRIENAMLRAQMYMISSQPKKQYPSGGNIGFIKSDDSREKIRSRRETIKVFGETGAPEINSFFELKDGSKLKVDEIENKLPFLQYLQLKAGQTNEDFKSQYLNSPFLRNDQRE